METTRQRQPSSPATQRRRDAKQVYRRSGGFALLATTVFIAVAGWAGSPSIQTAGLGQGHGKSGAGGSVATSLVKQSSGNSGRGNATALSPGNPTRLLIEWTACMRRHGDPDQTEPSIDAHGVINITTPALAGSAPPPAFPPTPALRQRRAIVAGGSHEATGRCSEHLAAAQRALRAAHPVRDPQGVDQAVYLKYVSCMRANGVPNYPWPEPNDPTATNFIGSGVNPNSPAVARVNRLCGKKLGLPTWWINGWGPPGDVTFRAAGLPGSAPACAFSKKGCRAHGVSVPGV